LAFALANVGEVRIWQADFKVAEPRLEECLALSRGLGEAGRWGLAIAHNHLAEAAFFQGAHRRADALLAESARLFRQLRDRWGLANTLESNAAVALRRGDKRRAVALVKEGLSLQRELNYPFGWMHVLNRLGRSINEARAAADYGRVTALLAESLGLAHEVGHLWGISESLRKLAQIAMVQGQPERAARLLGAAKRLREASPTRLPPYPLEAYEPGLDALRALWPLRHFGPRGLRGGR
jgi:hypothetical protein